MTMGLRPFRQMSINDVKLCLSSTATKRQQRNRRDMERNYRGVRCELAVQAGTPYPMYLLAGGHGDRGNHPHGQRAQHESDSQDS